MCNIFKKKTVEEKEDLRDNNESESPEVAFTKKVLKSIEESPEMWTSRWDRTGAVNESIFNHIGDIHIYKNGSFLKPIPYTPPPDLKKKLEDACSKVIKRDTQNVLNSYNQML